MDLSKLEAEVASWIEPDRGTLLKWEAGTTLVGELLSMAKSSSENYGEGLKIVVRTKNDEVVTAFCPTILRNKLEEQKVQAGMLVMIKCFGVDPSKDSNAKEFKMKALWGNDDMPAVFKDL